MTVSPLFIFVRNIALLASVMLFALHIGPPAPSTPSDDPLNERDILSYGFNHDGFVEYDYVGETLPAQLAEGEVPSLRGSASYTRYLGTDKNGAPIYELTAYSKEVFTEVSGAWHHIESATTTRTRFAAARAGDPDGIFSLPKAHADSMAPFSTSADGYTSFSAFGTFEVTLFSIVECSSASFIEGTPGEDFAGTTAAVTAQYNSTGFGSCDVSRVYLPFDTSSLGTGATISDATLSVYVTAKTNQVNDGSDTIRVTQGSSTFGSFGFTSGATSIDIGSITTSAYNTFTLDSTGRGWINKSGTTELGLRELHEISGSMSSSVAGNSITISTSEQTGTSQDPYLTITYSPASPPSRVMRISEGFVVKIIQGTVRVYEQ